MIPRKAHFFWSGEQMSYCRWLTLASFRKMNPDWEMFLHVCDHLVFPKSPSWTSLEKQEFYQEPIGQNYIDRIADLGVESRRPEPHPGLLSPTHASDFFAWKILSTEGGVYSDMDILYIRPMSTCETMLESDTVISVFDYHLPGVKRKLVANAIGFLASGGGNQMFAEFLRHSEKRIKKPGYQSLGADVVRSWVDTFGAAAKQGRFAASTEIFMESLRASFPLLKIHNIGDGVVYPVPWNHAEQIWENDVSASFPKSVIGLHWFGGSPKTQEHATLVTEDNISRLKNTFSACASMAGMCAN